MYLWLLEPTVGIGDSGELITAAVRLGVPHPPGYPLWSLAGHAVYRMFPFGNPAYRVNLSSAIFGAIAAALLARLGQRRFGPVGVFAGPLGGLGLAFAGQSVVAEVYTLNAAIVFGALLCLDRLFGGDRRLFLLGGLLVGAGLAHHPLMAIFAPAFLILGLWGILRPSPGIPSDPHPKNYNTIIKSGRRGKWAIAGLLLAGLGFCFYAYLPLRSAKDPPINWGEPKNWENFRHHLLRTQYRNLELASGFDWDVKKKFLRHLGGQLAGQAGPQTGPAPLLWTGLGLAGLFGLLLRCRRPAPDRRAAGFFLLSSFLLFLLNTAGLLAFLHFRPTWLNFEATRPYFLPAFGIWGLWAAAPLSLLFQGCRRLLGVLLLLASAALAGGLAWQRRDLRFGRWNFLAHDFGRDLLRSAPAGATLILDREADETLFVLTYLLRAENRRPDLRVYDSYGNIFTGLYHTPLFRRMTRSQAEAHRRKREIALARRTELLYSGVDPFLEGYRPAGLLWRRGLKEDKEKFPYEVLAGRGRWPAAALSARSREVVARYPYMEGQALLAVDFEEARLRLMEAADLGRGLAWPANNAGRLLWQRRYFADASGLFQRALEEDPDYGPAWHNLGALRLQLGDLDTAAEALEQALRLDPEDSETRRLLAEVRGRRGVASYQARDLAGAARDLRAAHELFPGGLWTYNLALVLAESGDASAASYFQEYLRANPRGRGAAMARRWLRQHGHR